MPDQGSVLLLGATGLVGGHCLRLLAADARFSRVFAWVRRPLTQVNLPAKVVQVVGKFDVLSSSAPCMDVETVICCLGTTIKKAGSQAAFQKVDFEYPTEVARMALARGARHFLLVSAVGASPASRIFYNRVKGEVEQALQGMGYPHITIVRPSLLLGERSESRFGEELAKPFGWLMPSKMKPVHASQVAAALVAFALQPGASSTIVENPELRQFPAQS